MLLPRNILSLLAYGLVSIVAEIAPIIPMPNPWPDAFSVPFVETMNVNGKLYAKNTGIWYYDYTDKVARYDHGKGQWNNFCGCGSNTTEECRIIFAADDILYVHFPTLSPPLCCSVCNTAQGCGLLKPDWISAGKNVTYDGVWNIEGRECNTWHESGEVATDYWSSTVEDHLPCMYHETIDMPQDNMTIDHNLTMDPTKYIPEKPDPALFVVPKICHQPCSGTFGVTCG